MTFWKQTPKLLSKLKTDGSLNQILEKNDHDTISSKSFDTGKIKAFVESGAAYIKDVGRDKALTEFSKKQGKFSKSELYIFCISMEGTTLAHVCQSALKNDPPSASNIDPPQRVSFGRYS